MKPDADAIRQWVAGLPALFGADTSRAWWAKFAFRFDTMPSVAAILRSGCLLSRQECAHRGITHHDAANQSVIEKTAHAHDLVRLYFRPCTPTQYNMEGIKAAQELAATGEHCPVPVFLLFDLADTLIADGVRFTDGSMANASRYRMGDDVSFLRSIPMSLVYHDGPFVTPPGKDELKFRRQAEIIRDRELTLDSLRLVACRTAPERDTLLHLLGDDAPRWADRIRIPPAGRGVFYRERGFHVRDVRYTGSEVQFDVYRRDFRYAVHLRIRDADSGELLVDKRGTGHVAETFSKPVPLGVGRVEVELTVEGHTAYRAVLTQQRIFR